MEEKPYRLVITELKESHGAIFVDMKITEEELAWIIAYLRTSPRYPHDNPTNEPQKKQE